MNVLPNPTGPDYGVVYFAQCEAGGPIKIGVTTNRWGYRVTDIRRNGKRAYPLALINGGNSTELRFHAMLEPHHIGGEWFSPVGEVFEVIAHLHAGIFKWSRLPPFGWCVTKPYQVKASVAHWGPLPRFSKLLELTPGRIAA